MTERWRTELDKLRSGELPADLWGRIGEGPQLEPLGPSPPTGAATTSTSSSGPSSSSAASNSAAPSNASNAPVNP